MARPTHPIARSVRFGGIVGSLGSFSSGLTAIRRPPLTQAASMLSMQSDGRTNMHMLDQSAEYYRLREGHERALALAAKTSEQRREHLKSAKRYASLANGLAEPRLNTGIAAMQRGSSSRR